MSAIHNLVQHISTFSETDFFFSIFTEIKAFDNITSFVELIDEHLLSDLYFL